MVAFDKSVFKIHSFKEAENSVLYWQKKSPAEKLAAAWTLILSAYNLDQKIECRLDRTQFKMLKRT